MPYSNAYVRNSAKYANDIGSLPRFLATTIDPKNTMDGKEFFEILERKASEEFNLTDSVVADKIDY